MTKKTTKTPTCADRWPSHGSSNPEAAFNDDVAPIADGPWDASTEESARRQIEKKATHDEDCPVDAMLGVGACSHHYRKQTPSFLLRRVAGVLRRDRRGRLYLGLGHTLSQCLDLVWRENRMTRSHDAALCFAFGGPTG